MISYPHAKSLCLRNILAETSVGLPFLVFDTPVLTYAILFVWGGAFVGIYTIVMTEVGGRFHGGDLVSVYAAMSVAWGAGAFIGPDAAGSALAVYGQPVSGPVSDRRKARHALGRANRPTPGRYSYRPSLSPPGITRAPPPVLHTLSGAQ